jgi:hypothetical protein
MWPPWSRHASGGTSAHSASTALSFETVLPRTVFVFPGPERVTPNDDGITPSPGDTPLKQPRSFRCNHCRLDVPTDAPGTAHRNHCPNCLWSRHVDDDPGDRASDCLASMEPIAITVRKDGEWVLIHRCNGCGTLSSNRIAGDDNPLLLVRIAVKPLAQPPFPLDRLALI